jgi:RHS repeat-associated protein
VLIWSPNGRLIAQVNNAGPRYFLGDVQGSTRLLTDSAGQITSSYDYSAFGELTDSPSVETAYLYTGQQYDAATEMYSLRARYYAPGAGRFVSRDVWPVDYGDPWELNRYGYVGNGPIRGSDPSGWNAAAPAIGAGTSSGSQSGGGSDYAMLLQMITLINVVARVAVLGIACWASRHVSRLFAHARAGLPLILMEAMQPSPHPCHIPVQITPGFLMPAIAAHIRSAQGQGYPMLLYYHADKKKKQTIRDYVCPRGPSHRRPAGMQCDEYPYASTDIYQGQPATPRISSTTLVPEGENSFQGQLLGAVEFGIGFELLGIDFTIPLGGFYVYSMLNRPGEFAAVVL